MTHLDLSPAPGAAPGTRRLLRQAAMELRLTLRNGEQVLLTFVIPVLLLVAGSRSSRLIGGDRPIDVIAPGVLALAILSTSFTSLAIATAFERRYGVLKRLGATPLSRTGLLGGKVLAVALVQLGQFVVLSGLALALGWRPTGGPAAWFWLVLLALLATIAFGGLGLLMAGTLRAEATLALANLVTTPVIASGGVSSMADLRALKAAAGDAIAGVICGRALYDGRIDPAEAVALLQPETDDRPPGGGRGA